MSNRVRPIPKDHPVQPLKSGEYVASIATCGHCRLSWDDGKVTSMTPVPAARCPFEEYHVFTFDQAVLASARAVEAAPLNMTVEMFHSTIPSLVVRTDQFGYLPMTVAEWRALTVAEWHAQSKPPEVVLTISGRDSFGG